MSRVIAVRKYTNFSKSETVRSVQYQSFHGSVFRDVETRRWEPAQFGLADISPLHVIRDGNHVPDIFRPAAELIVSESVKSKLAGTPFVDFVEVVFDKIVNFHFPKGDFSIYDRQPGFDPWKALEAAEEVPRLRAKVGRYYEVVSIRHQDIVEKSPVTARIPFSRRGREETKREDIYEISAEMLQTYPLHWYWGWHMMTLALFEKLEKHFDWDFFRKEVIEF